MLARYLFSSSLHTSSVNALMKDGLTTGCATNWSASKKSRPPRRSHIEYFNSNSSGGTLAAAYGST